MYSCRIQHLYGGHLRGLVGAIISLALFSIHAHVLAASPTPAVSWYGDPSAPDLSGVWVRSDEQTPTGRSGAASKEGWAPWPPSLKPSYAKIWNKRVQETASGRRTDDPITSCLPPGMPRFMSGTKGPLLIIQTPGRVTLHRDGWPPRRFYLDGRAQPNAKDLEDFFNGNSVGHYEGATLVVETIGVKDEPIDATGIPHSEKLKIVERLSKVDNQTLKVLIELSDPIAFTKSLKATIMYTALIDPLWEPKDQICTPRSNYHPEVFVK